MVVISTFVLPLSCLLGALIPNTHALQYEPCDPLDLDDPPPDLLYNQPRYPFTTSIGNLDDLIKFIDHSPPPNAAHSDSPSSSSSSDFNEERETVFIFLDTTPLLPTTESSSSSSSESPADDPSPKKFDPYFWNTIVRHLKHTFHEFAQSRRDEPYLRFGILSPPLYSQNDLEGAKAARRTLEEMIQKLGIDPSKLESGLAAVLCLHCNGIPEQTETWGFGLEYPIPEAEEAVEAGAAEFGGGVDSKERTQWRKVYGTEENQWRMVFKKREKEMERWMGSMARGVIAELTEGNLGRVREVCCSFSFLSLVVSGTCMPTSLLSSGFCVDMLLMSL